MYRLKDLLYHQVHTSSHHISISHLSCRSLECPSSAVRTRDEISVSVPALLQSRAELLDLRHCADVLQLPYQYLVGDVGLDRVCSVDTVQTVRSKHPFLHTANTRILIDRRIAFFVLFGFFFGFF